MAGNNSSINPKICIQGAVGIGSRLSVTIEQLAHGFSKGMAVRWNSGVDGNDAKYVAAKCTNAYEAEVVGIVTEVLSVDAFELTTSGVVNMTDFFGSSIGSGYTADDVFFLGTTAGFLDTNRPTTPGFVAKPVITRLAEDSNDPPRIFGSVTNYVGSLLGGNAAASIGDVAPAGIIQPYLGSLNSIPSGWAICDGVGLTDSSGIPGFDVSAYSSYYNAVGMRYGGVEKLTLSGNYNIDDRVRQTVNGRQIEGLIKARVGDDYYVEQSISANTSTGYNQNFITGFEIDNLTRGSNDVAEFTKPQTDIFTFVTGSVTVLLTNGTLVSDTITASSVHSVLPPDLRGKFLYGESDQNNLGQEGGNRSFTVTESNIGAGTLGGNDTIFNKQLTLPPYTTLNYIVRYGDSASASILDDISLKNLKITNLPTSDPSVAGALYNDGGTLKVSSG